MKRLGRGIVRPSASITPARMDLSSVMGQSNPTNHAHTIPHDILYDELRMNSLVPRPTIGVSTLASAASPCSRN